MAHVFVLMFATLFVFPVAADPLSELLAAIRAGNEAAFMRALDAGAPVDATNERGASPLHAAVAAGQQVMTRVLLGRGANITRADGQGRTPLHLAAAMHDNLTTLNLLLEQGALTTATTTDRQTPLHLAARAGNNLTFCRLVLAGADMFVADARSQTPLDVLKRHLKTLQDEPTAEPARSPLLARSAANLEGSHLSMSLDRGSTLLHAMAETGDLEATQNLLRHGNVNVLDGHRMTPLHRAIRGGHVEVISALLGAGADPRLPSEMGATAIHFAAAFATPAVLDLLVAAGADVNAMDDLRRTPMHIAANLGRYDMVRALRAHGAGVDPTDADGNTPLLRAARRGFLVMCAFLIANGANVFAENADGHNFLAITDAHGYTEVRDIISSIIPTTLRDAIDARDHRSVLSALAASHDPRRLLETTNQQGQTVMHQLVAQARPAGTRVAALHIPVAVEREITPRELIETLRGVAPLTGRWMLNHRDANGMTPVHLAALLNRPDLIVELAQQGADLEIPDTEGMTPLLLAANEGHTEAVSALLGRGARLAARDRNGMTALHLAARWGHGDAMIVLIAQGADLFAEDTMRRTPWLLVAHHPRMRDEIIRYVGMVEAQHTALGPQIEGWQETLRATDNRAQHLVDLLRQDPSTAASPTLWRFVLGLIHPRTQQILGALFTLFASELRIQGLNRSP